MGLGFTTGPPHTSSGGGEAGGVAGGEAGVCAGGGGWTALLFAGMAGLGVVLEFDDGGGEEGGG
jgi:hypothetical protein